MKKRIVTVVALLMVAVCMASFVACGGEQVKATKANVEKIDNTMDLAAVESLIGKASHDLRGGLQNGRVAWNVSFESKKTATTINIYIDFDENGKVKNLDSRSMTNPIEGGMAEVDWEIQYPR